MYVTSQSLWRAIMNTDGEELITDAQEIRVQSAIMSRLEDVNSSQFLLGQIWKISVDTAWNYIKEHFRKVNEYLKFGLNFHKKCYQRNLLNK